MSRFEDKEPQINADERRLIDQDSQQLSEKYEQIQHSCSKIHVLRHEDAPRHSLRITLIQRMFMDPCKSAPSVKSAFYHTDSLTKSTDRKVSAFICVHPRFFDNVVFQTGWTRYDLFSIKFNFLKNLFMETFIAGKFSLSDTSKIF